MKIELLRETDSTNNYIKRYLSGGENVIVCAERQTGGKGTKGRSFSSNDGGVYFSALNFYENFPASNAFQIMTHSAVAVCRTAEAFSVTPQIKWANDIYVGNKKLCGILIENECRNGYVKHSIVGIGINVNNDLSSLGGIAVGLSEAAGRKLSVAEVRDKLIENWNTPDDFSDYLSYVRFLGRDVLVTEGERKFLATALRILEGGRLEISEQGKIRALSSAEISLKF
ncbi:MAG: biotin--[acetyl-CoA-carboxylase] ligase [Clostridiales bacterium]|nr:biotin--[acetyl-CoA-carboxylase] ligase [Clostridiales bacterium]